jgi:hypothetical protein
MNITSFDQVSPVDGFLTARVFENEHIGLKPTLFFDIHLPLRPFEFDGEEVSTSVELQFIQLPVGPDWRSIADQSYEFPVNPEEGCIDGSVYLAGAHNPADVTRLTFGAIEPGRISCTLEVTFDFAYEGPAELGAPTLTWDVQLAVDEQDLDSALAQAQELQR